MIRTNYFGNTQKKSGNLEYTITAEQTKTERKETEQNTLNIQDTIFACKTLRSQGNGETTHLTDADTNEVIHCVSKMHEWIMKAWMPLFKMYEDKPEPTWSAFKTEYENELRGWVAECPSRNTRKGARNRYQKQTKRQIRRNGWLEDSRSPCITKQILHVKTKSFQSS